MRHAALPAGRPVGTKLVSGGAAPADPTILGVTVPDLPGLR